MEKKSENRTLFLRMIVAVLSFYCHAWLVAQNTANDSIKRVLYAEEIYEGYLAKISQNQGATKVLSDSLKALKEEPEPDSVKMVKIQEEIEAMKREIAKNNIPLYRLAYTPWRYVMDHTPSKRLKHYTDGITIITELRGDSAMSASMKQTYADELMALYDDWIGYADTLNKIIDNPFTKTYVRILKIKDYRSIYGDSESQPYWRKLYTMIQEVINDSTATDKVSDYDYDTYYRYSLYADRLYQENKEEFADLYPQDKDIAQKGLEDAMALMAQGEASNRISMPQNMLDDINDRYTSHYRGSGNFERDEATFMAQMEENFTDEKFLKQVISSMQWYADSSKVFVEALQNYLMYVDSKNGLYARLLARIYVKQNRIAESLQYYKVAADNETDILDKSTIQYRMASLYFKEMNNISYAAQYAKMAIRNNPDYGDAYVLLAKIYADKRCEWVRGTDYVNNLKFLICIDKCELAKRCIRKSQADPMLKKYNQHTESEVNKDISFYQKSVPFSGDVFMESAKYSKQGTQLSISGGPMKGETTTIRFYD